MQHDDRVDLVFFLKTRGRERERDRSVVADVIEFCLREPTVVVWSSFLSPIDALAQTLHSAVWQSEPSARRDDFCCITAGHWVIAQAHLYRRSCTFLEREYKYNLYDFVPDNAEDLSFRPPPCLRTQIFENTIL